ncbi:MAG: glutaredoxin domain-containing protein [Bdellovibrionota bacterium]
MKQTAKIKLIKKIPCPFCDRAINFFNNKGYQVEIIDLTNNLDELLAWKQKTGWQTVPMIFINDTMIGGYNDLKALDEEGKLDAMVMGS